MHRSYFHASLFIMLWPSLVNACELLPVVEQIIESELPAFVLAFDREVEKQCTTVARADFNGDGKADYAAVLTEKTPPKKYNDGTPWRQGYVVVLIASALPYSKYQAVLLLGHESRPDRYWLETRGSKKPLLTVHNAGYSITEYEWQPNGFVVRKHEAD